MEKKSTKYKIIINKDQSVNIMQCSAFGPLTFFDAGALHLP